MGTPKKVLILSVTAGAGHLRAAQALEEAFRERYPQVEIAHLDALEYTNAAYRKGFSDGYEKLIKSLPSVWGMIYGRLEERPPHSSTTRLVTLFDRLNAGRLRKAVQDFAPDAIVCTHFLPAEVFGAARRKRKLAVRVGVALTDYDIHAMWVQEGVDHYFVATEEMADAMRLRGTPGAKVHVTGIPILPVFTRRLPEPSAMRQRLGLRPASSTVLISAGGFGMMRADEVVGLLAERIPDIQLLAVAGKNQRLHAQLERVASRYPGKILPFGFVTNMHELMAASDFAVAKSGGLTTSECLALGLPMVVFKPIPGQEERNATYLLEQGVGVWAHTAAHMVFKVEQLLKNPERLACMREAARRIARPDAAYRITDLVMGEMMAQTHA
ncbi:MAG: glycosyltransferase [Candidatus Hydrogenedentes bacterium]|nr:glycosyltransferase [Candidatus Hydrogenedentota bacterium]